MQQWKKKLSFAEIEIRIDAIGEDICVQVYGGERPHVGCVALAVPRPSLKDPGRVSATSSVLNITGHKDEQICRYLAEKIAARRNTVIVCTGGFHVDHITQAQIQELLDWLEEFEFA